MDPTRTGPVALAETRLRWLDARQRVLAQNVANADTPGYRPSDLQPFAQSLVAAAPAAALRQTSPQHLAGNGGADPRARPERRLADRSMDGNGVALDREAMRIADTETAHALAIGLHRRYLAMFRTALGRNS
ncbi:flagellar biosynthesis protein FlgB [Roseomonas eburnea]|uniref:Flagellar basal body rod protein FlgB n=1 Tax=Neoroseomonas eburnea TaxID=1346889 RepID=A0A9X9XHB1_9PROT|nr:flagellar basal body protein [Neoroseomonas eburnea]MBR0683097.1 flagellar biosynthesis protein FlgB [Neoroseomonas eburnea]